MALLDVVTVTEPPDASDAASAPDAVTRADTEIALGNPNVVETVVVPMPAPQREPAPAPAPQPMPPATPQPAPAAEAVHHLVVAFLGGDVAHGRLLPDALHGPDRVTLYSPVREVCR